MRGGGGRNAAYSLDLSSNPVFMATPKGKAARVGLGNLISWVICMRELGAVVLGLMVVLCLAFEEWPAVSAVVAPVCIVASSACRFLGFPCPHHHSPSLLSAE